MQGQFQKFFNTQGHFGNLSPRGILVILPSRLRISQTFRNKCQIYLCSNALGILQNKSQKNTEYVQKALGFPREKFILI